MWQRAGQDWLGETYTEYDGYGFVNTEFNWAFNVSKTMLSFRSIFSAEQAQIVLLSMI